MLGMVSLVWFLVYMAALSDAIGGRWAMGNPTLAVLLGGPVMWFLAGGAIVITFFKRWTNR